MHQQRKSFFREHKFGHVSTRPQTLPANTCQVDAELLALEGAPSVAAALRALRESPGSDAPPPAATVRVAAELLLVYVTNALRDPRDPRVHRVRAGNPAFQRSLGRLGGCEGAMMAIGFEPQDRGTTFVLGAGTGGGLESRKNVARGRREEVRCNFAHCPEELWGVYACVTRVTLSRSVVSWWKYL